MSQMDLCFSILVSSVSFEDKKIPKNTTSRYHAATKGKNQPLNDPGHSDYLSLMSPVL